MRLQLPPTVADEGLGGSGTAMSLPRHRFLSTLVSPALTMLSAVVTGVISCIAAHKNATRTSGNAMAVWALRSQVKAAEANVDYLRRVYDSTRGWYTASETKAQLLLAVNGTFVTVLFGILFVNSG